MQKIKRQYKKEIQSRENTRDTEKKIIKLKEGLELIEENSENNNLGTPPHQQSYIHQGQRL